MAVAANSDHIIYVFQLLCHFPPDLEITWSYDEAQHFKGPHDGIGGSVKRKVYSDVKSQKVANESAKTCC